MDKENTLLFVGYQAYGTLGRHIIDGAEEVRIFGKMRQIRARVAQIHGFSGHADRNELLEWVGHVDPAPKKVIVTHGEENSAKAFGELIKEKLGFDVLVPQYKDVAILD